MARSQYVYVFQHCQTRQILGTFTVKWEAVREWDKRGYRDTCGDAECVDVYRFLDGCGRTSSDHVRLDMKKELEKEKERN